VLYPPYGPDPAPNPFFLFGYLKEKLCGAWFTPRDDRISAIRQIFFEIPEMGVKNVFTNGITILCWVMKKGGENDTQKLEKRRIIFIE
jgi:hypothetical protein